MKPEQRKAPYKQAGGTDKQINDFLLKYPQENGNATCVDFFKNRLLNEQFADNSFQNFKTFNASNNYMNLVGNNTELGIKTLNIFGKDAADYVKLIKNNPELGIKALDFYSKQATNFINFANSNSYDGLGFLNEYPQFTKDYQIVLPFKSVNSTHFSGRYTTTS